MLLAEPFPPTAVWLYLDADGEVRFECGRCGAWWFAASVDGPLEAELRCEGCDAAEYARRFGVRLR